ncbi:MAG: TadE family protein [Dehalococcoidia bacterium]
MSNATKPGKGPRKRLRSSRGQSMAELGLVLPIIMLIIVGVVEIADGMNAYLTVVDSARDGARLGAKGGASDDEIKNLVVTETDRLRDPIDPSTDITVDHVTVDGVDAIRVEVCNDRSLLMGVPLVLPEDFRMCSTTTMRVLPAS